MLSSNTKNYETIMNTKVLNRLYFNMRSINLFLFLSIFCSLGLNASDKYNDKRINNYRWNLNSERWNFMDCKQG